MSENILYNQRQYARILELIGSFETGKVSFDRLVRDIEALIMTMENISPDYKNILLSKWGILEEVYAVSMDQGLTEVSPEYQQTINSSLSDLCELIKNYQEK